MATHTRSITSEEFTKHLDNLSPEATQTLIEQTKSEIALPEDAKDEDILVFIKAWVALSPKINDMFIAMCQGPLISMLSLMSARSLKPSINTDTGEVVITGVDFTLFMDKYSAFGTSVKKTLAIATIYLTNQNRYKNRKAIKTDVSIPFNEYIRWRNIPETKPSIDKARRVLKEDLDTLFGSAVEWTERSGGEIKDYDKTRLISRHYIKKGIIFIRFTPEFAEYLINAYVMKFAITLLQIDERNPNTYNIGYKLLLHYGMDNNRIRGTHDIISIKKLLEACPDIPTEKEVMSKDRATSRNITEPLFNALNILVDIGFLEEYELTKAKRTPLDTYDNMDGSETIPYKDIKNLYLIFKIKDFPDQTARIKAKKEKKQRL